MTNRVLTPFRLWCDLLPLTFYPLCFVVSIKRESLNCSPKLRKPCVSGCFARYGFLQFPVPFLSSAHYLDVFLHRQKRREEKKKRKIKKKRKKKIGKKADSPVVSG